MDFKNKKITLMGLGIVGGAVEDALFFIARGAQLTITDLKSAKELTDSIKRLEGFDITWRLGGHKEEDFIHTDLVIKNPAVGDDSKYIKIAKDNNVPVDTSVGIFSELINMDFIVGITGTKGKSTTAALAHHIVKTHYPNSYLAGNIGKSPLSYIEKKEDYGILELSSWQLEGMEPHKKSPHVAVITNVQQDHLNRYHSYENYKNSKKLIFKHQGPQDILILNYDDPYLREIYKEAPSQVIFYSAKEKPTVENTKVGAYVENEIIHIGENTLAIKDVGIKRAYHIENILAALTITNILDVPSSKSFKALSTFPGLFGRLQYINTIKGIEIYNDTAATNPYATINSLRALGNKKVALILGGEDKELDYKNLSQELENVAHIILLPGSASDKIKSAASEAVVKRIQEVSSLKEALHTAHEAHPEVILFSPAAASFNMFKNEFDRGGQFNEEVARLDYNE